MKRALLAMAVLAGFTAQIWALDGTVTQFTFDGPYTDDIPLAVYTPPGYSQGSEYYPVVYHLHGINGTYNGNQINTVPASHEAAVDAQLVSPCIIVFPDGYLDAWWADSYNSNKPAETNLIYETIPYIDSHYRTLASREYRVVEGFSMGGFGAAKCASKFPELFCACVIYDGALLNWSQVQSSHAALAEEIFNDDEDYFDQYSPWYWTVENAGTLETDVPFRQVVGALTSYNSSYNSLLNAYSITNQYVTTGCDHNLSCVLDAGGEDSWEFIEGALGQGGSDTTAPGNVTNMSATPGDTQIALSWTNPGDGDLAGIKVQRKTGSYPTGPADGTTAYDSSGTGFTDSGLSNGTTYYYTAYAYDEVPNYASGTSLTATPTSGGGSSEETFYPTDDCYSAKSYDFAHGTNADIRTSAETANTRYGYLMFTVSGISGTVTGATLRLYCVDGGSNATAYAVSSTSWDETTLTWSNQPSMGSSLDSVSNPAASAWQEFDVTSHIAGNGTFSIGIQTSDTGSVYYSSKEGSYDPELVVTYSASDTTAPGPVTSFSATAGDTLVSLSWANPGDGDLAGVRVQRKTGSYPTGPTDGTNIYNALGTSTTDTGLSNGTTYYYAAYAYDEVPNYSTAATASAAPASEPAEIVFDNSAASEDGWVQESSETSNVGGTTQAGWTGASGIIAGDNYQDKQYKGVLSFDTSSLPDGATIVSAMLRLKRGGVTGTNPFTTHGSCYVDIRTGGFNGSTSLETADFQASATASQAATLSNAASDGDWSEGSLNSSGLSAINKTGTTQLRVYFATDDNDDSGNDYIGWYPGDNATQANRPQLVVEYQ